MKQMQLGRLAVALLAAVLTTAPMARGAKTKQVIADDALSEAISTELRHASGIGANAIRVEVAGGVVTLSGTAEHLLEKDRAVLTAMGIRGVRSVVDKLTLPAATRTDAAIAADVVAAFESDAVVESYQVKASATNSVVTLTGQVDSNRERLQAVRVAKSVRGVREVVDQITVPVRAVRVDDELETDIKSALHWDRLLEDDRIRVRVSSGDVTLTGTVGSGLEKMRAGHLAYIPGVHSVHNKIDVTPGPRKPAKPLEVANIPDATLAAAVRATLGRDPRTADFGIDVSSSGHIVTLSGPVHTLAAKRAAAQSARNTAGVFGVVDKIEVTSSLRSDVELASAVRAAIARDPWVGTDTVAVDVVGGVVTLSGAVDSAFERGHTDAIVAGIRGVRRIENHLKDGAFATPHWEPRIDEWDPQRYPWFERPARPTADDAAIAAEIRRELTWSPFVDGADVKVTVRDGVAFLDGTVDSTEERAAATENAYEGGAISVVNRLNARIDM